MTFPPVQSTRFDNTPTIRQYNDYGFTQCSTISGINQSIWEQMGLKHKFWDIHAHTVAEVEYDGAFHCYDNSLSAIYTLCDGKTIAGVEDIGKDGACALSGGKVEPGHIARYHCLAGTSKNGFLMGGDCSRSLESEGCHVFRAPGLAYRYYFYSWDSGHTYNLNLRENETYTRYYHRLDKKDDGDEKKEGYKFTSDPAYYTPNPNPNVGGRDPESVNPRYRIRGNGLWTFRPVLTPREYIKYIHSAKSIVASEQGLHPEKPAAAAGVLFRIQSANVATSQHVAAVFTRKTDADAAKISVSIDNGLNWKEIWKATALGESKADVKVIAEVNGSYEQLWKIELFGAAAAADAQLNQIAIETITQVNTKTLPKLNLGKNTIFVGAGDQTEALVYWPDLQGDNWKPMVVDSKNIVTDKTHQSWHAVMRQAAPGEAYVTYKMDAPSDIVKLNYGARIYNYGTGTHVDYLHSFDDGKTWIKSFTQSAAGPPFDVIHYQVVDQIPAGTKSVLFKFVIEGNTAPGEQSWGFYALRMEADYKPADTNFQPLEITYKWKEVQADHSKIERSHTQRVEKLPLTYFINVGGDDLPAMESLSINLSGAVANVKPGYSDGKDVGGEKFIHRWRTDGRNLAEGKSYTLSIPPNKSDDKGNKLTDGKVGPPFAGGGEPTTFGACWENASPEITVDLGKDESCGAFRIHLTAG